MPKNSGMETTKFHKLFSSEQERLEYHLDVNVREWSSVYQPDYPACSFETCAEEAESCVDSSESDSTDEETEDPYCKNRTARAIRRKNTVYHTMRKARTTNVLNQKTLKAKSENSRCNIPFKTLTPRIRISYLPFDTAAKQLSSDCDVSCSDSLGEFQFDEKSVVIVEHSVHVKGKNAFQKAAISQKKNNHSVATASSKSSCDMPHHADANNQADAQTDNTFVNQVVHFHAHNQVFIHLNSSKDAMVVPVYMVGPTPILVSKRGKINFLAII